MLLGTLSMGMSIIVLNVHFSHENEKVPKWVETVILNGLARVLCMRPKRGGSAACNTDSDSSDSDDPYSTSHTRDGVLHSYINDQVQIKENAFRILGKKAKRLKCFSCRRSKKKSTGYGGRRRRKDLPYEWREVTRVLDRLFFVIVAVLMFLSTFLTLYLPVYASHLVKI